jgi:hypothetical protein
MSSPIDKDAVRSAISRAQPGEGWRGRVQTGETSVKRIDNTIVVELRDREQRMPNGQRGDVFVRSPISSHSGMLRSC